jgi:hypothetical protein
MDSRAKNRAAISTPYYYLYQKIFDFKAGQAEAQYCIKSQNIHMIQPSFLQIPSGVLFFLKIIENAQKFNENPFFYLFCDAPCDGQIVIIKTKLKCRG